jgi:D-alanine-D-alanine ligase
VKRRLRVLVLMHPTLVPPASREGFSERESYAWKTEYDVVTTLREIGHQVEPLGVQYELAPIRDRVTEGKPDVVFNLLEEFHGVVEFDHHVVSYLELLRAHYTGCNPRGLVLARDKGLVKKLCIYHHIRVPAFAVFPRGRRVVRPRRLAFPLIVKSLSQEASVGIAQASIVDSDERLAERVTFVHDTIRTDALAEQYVEGRELYVGVLGNRRLQVLPIWELVFENLPPGSAAIATARAKHDPEYQQKRGIYQKPAGDLSPQLQARIARTSRRVCRILELDGYARIDYRLSPEGEIYFLEANPNPEIAKSEEFAAAAEAAGMPYPKLLQRVLNLGLQREPR